VFCLREPGLINFFPSGESERFDSIEHLAGLLKPDLHFFIRLDRDQFPVVINPSALGGRFFGVNTLDSSGAFFSGESSSLQRFGDTQFPLLDRFD
jgi:hypothetical protein